MHDTRGFKCWFEIRILLPRSSQGSVCAIKVLRDGESAVYHINTRSNRHRCTVGWRFWCNVHLLSRLYISLMNTRCYMLVCQRYHLTSVCEFLCTLWNEARNRGKIATRTSLYTDSTEEIELEMRWIIQQEWCAHCLWSMTAANTLCFVAHVGMHIVS
jgi:hypothetical protein